MTRSHQPSHPSECGRLSSPVVKVIDAGLSSKYDGSRSQHFASQGRRSYQGHRREVCRQSGNRHRFALDPLPLSPGRSGFTPSLSLAYDSGNGNGPYGFGWNVIYPTITRRTDRGLPQYRDDQESDVFILSGSEDLVPVSEETREGYRIHRYRPRIEGSFLRIERWASFTDSSDVYWRTFSQDNTTTFFGRTAESRIADPSDPSRIFTWLLCESFDDKGNAAVYDYVAGR